MDRLRPIKPPRAPDSDLRSLVKVVGYAVFFYALAFSAEPAGRWAARAFGVRDADWLWSSIGVVIFVCACVPVLVQAQLSAAVEARWRRYNDAVTQLKHRRVYSERQPFLRPRFGFVARRMHGPSRELEARIREGPIMITIPHLTTKQREALYEAWLRDHEGPVGRRKLRSTITVARGLVALGLLAEHPDRSPRGEIFFFMTRHGLAVADALFAPEAK